MFSHTNLEFSYELQRDLLSFEEEPRRKDYSRNRSARPRRKSRRRASIGMAGRRLRRASA